MKNEHYEGVASFNIAYYSMDSKKIFCFLTFYPFVFFKTYIFYCFAQPSFPISRRMIIIVFLPPVSPVKSFLQNII